MSTCAIVLHLRIRVKEENRETLLEFLREARPFYEAPGGIKMRLLQDVNDCNAFIEVFEYETQQAYELDDQRVQHDPQTKAVLAEWRSLLEGPPIVEVYADHTTTLD